MMIDEIKKQIHLGKTKKAIEILSSFTNELNNETKKKILKLTGDFNRLENDKHLGIIRENDADFKLNVINWTIINIVDYLESLNSTNKNHKNLVENIDFEKDDILIEVGIQEFERINETTIERNYIVMSAIFKHSKEIIRLYLKRIDYKFLKKSIDSIKEFLKIKHKKLKIIVDEPLEDDLQILKPLTELYYLFEGQIEIKKTTQMFTKPKGKLHIGISEFHFMVGDGRMYRMEYANRSLFHGNFNNKRIATNLISFFDNSFGFCEKISLKITL